MILWKPLRVIFINLPKENKRREIISSTLNKTRIFRNRIFHFEPILWKPEALLDNIKNIKLLLSWIDKEYLDWVESQSSFHQVFDYNIAKLRDLGLSV